MKRTLLLGVVVCLLPVPVLPLRNLAQLSDQYIID